MRDTIEDGFDSKVISCSFLHNKAFKEPGVDYFFLKQGVDYFLPQFCWGKEAFPMERTGWFLHNKRHCRQQNAGSDSYEISFENPLFQNGKIFLWTYQLGWITRISIVGWAKPSLSYPSLSPAQSRIRPNINLWSEFNGTQSKPTVSPNIALASVWSKILSIFRLRQTEMVSRVTHIQNLMTWTKPCPLIFCEDKKPHHILLML